jgi:hypothetical protein
MFGRATARAARTSRGTVLPESRAIRILFYPSGTLPIFLGFWLITSVGFLALMTYRSLHPLTAFDLAIAVAFGALIPLTFMLGLKGRDLASACGLPRSRSASTVPAMLTSVVAAFVTCACCFPLIPMVLGLILSGTALASQVTPITLGIAQWSPVLYVASAALLLWSLHRNSRGLIRVADSS